VLIGQLTTSHVRVEVAARGPASRLGKNAASWTQYCQFVQLETVDGYRGLGEATPLPSTPSAALTADAQKLCTAAATPIEGPSRAYLVANSYASTAASRFALETAILDAWCNMHKIALAQALVSAPLRSLTSAAVVDNADDAVACVAQGFTTLKIKLSHDQQRDLVLASAIRNAVGDRIALRGDANQVWSVHETPQRLRALAHLGWQFIEEPCPQTIKLLAMDLPIPLALDESLLTTAPDQFASVLRAANLWGFVLKPTAIGGLLPTIGLAKLAAQAGKHATVTHALEGPIATAACAEAALAVASLFEHPVAAGVGNNPTLDPIDARWTVTPSQLATIGIVRFSDHPGLGVSGFDINAALRPNPS
jgi:L-alanine-DL-glutamate epimerase-like enolase superfamily enzyme